MAQAAKKRDDEFVVDNDGKANWCLRKIKHLKQKQQENEKLAQSQVEKIQQEIREVEEWLESENKKLQNSIDFFKNKLHGYALKLKEEDPEFKTKKLPFGKLQFRKKRPKWKYDEETLLDYVEDNLPEALKIKKKVSKRTLKKKADTAGNRAVIKETGEVVPGIRVIERPEQFKVKVNM